ncbi:MAG TPA: hypothetical protein PK098_06665 [Phycisphaerales bacterium]|nr:hypothetical protein [Phycisphaerales bacterium]
MTASTNTNGSKINGTHKWAAIIVTVVLALLAITVQWGVVTTKLDHVEKRLDELILEARAMRAEYQSIERRVSFLEGRSSGGAPSTGGRQNP